MSRDETPDRDPAFELAGREDEPTTFWLMSADCAHAYYVSPSYEAIWGSAADDLYVAPFKWLQSVHAEDQPRVFERLDHIAAGHEIFVDFRVHRPDGSMRRVRHRAYPIKDGTGRIAQVAMFSIDITERFSRLRQGEASLIAQRDALVREVHHRIKNNLQGVTGLLRNYSGQHPEVAAVLNEAIAQVQAVATIHGLHGQTGAMEVGFAALLEQIVSGIGQIMRRDLRVELPTSYIGCHVVVSDLEAVPVALVLNEMVFNAVKHCSSRAIPEIELRLDIGAERATVVISNPGHLPDRRRRSDAARALDGAGLQLIRSLLPARGAKFELANDPDGVRALLVLEPPILSVRC